MSDRELLELAAKAGGYDRLDQGNGTIVIQDDEGYSSAWNPLRNDGDALRLAVKLRLHVSVFADAIGIGVPSRGYEESKWADDPYAATRRAIVRAAAEIGRTMP